MMVETILYLCILSTYYLSVVGYMQYDHSAGLTTKLEIQQKGEPTKKQLANK